MRAGDWRRDLVERSPGFALLRTVVCVYAEIAFRGRLIRSEAMVAAYRCVSRGGRRGALRRRLGRLQDARIAAVDGDRAAIHHDSAQGKQVRVRLSGVNWSGLLRLAVFARWRECVLAFAPQSNREYQDVSYRFLKVTTRGRQSHTTS